MKNVQHKEDEYLSELIRKNNEISFFTEKFEQERKIRKKQDKVIQEKDKKLQENRKVIEENRKVIEEKDNMIIDLVKTLKGMGKSTEEIQKLTNLSKEEIEKI